MKARPAARRRKASPNTVRAFMTPRPQCVTSHDTLSTAARRMRAGRIRHLPVVDGGEPVGVVSERDLYAIERYRDVDPATVEVYEAMAPIPFEVSPDTPLDEVVSAMAENRYGSALVVEEGKLIGIFTTVDALRATLRLCRVPARRPAPKVRKPSRSTKRAAR